ncbi:class I SAM-dependent methyltransferase [Halonatronum saccharophilum]|uniref:class I SAM-dependent methyltransferase n=1 Tax=Halonatronum saccharophilum TaxID=150060 RepID=UPI0004872BA3|nr:class I SAM-dependent methyltransferase [Halonatronum saccharophilum]
MDFVKLNEKVWDKNVETGYVWTQPVSSQEVMKAKNGEWNIVMTPTKAVPKEWFPERMEGKDVLCLASGGGQQGPIMAALGANVTVFDNSQEQLNQDIMVAKRDGLKIKTVQGDMRDLSVFEDASFDLIIHPWSNGYIDNVLPVWEEAYRVLRSGGVLISGFANPIEYIFDLKNLNEGKFVVRHKIPYSDLTSISEEELKELVLDQGEGIIFDHTLEDQIGGQIKAGFLIGGFYEDIGGSALDEYINSSIATKAMKL